MTSSRVATFVLGVALGWLLARTPVVEAVDMALMFGSDNGAATAVQTTSTGAVKVRLN